LGIANQYSFRHHGLYTTLREAVLARAGEAAESRQRFEALSEHQRSSVVEFLKSLQIVPPGARSSCVTDEGEDTECPDSEHVRRDDRQQER
jgi:hypothetical protein